MVDHDAACAVLGLFASTVWLKLWSVTASRGWIDPKVTRKVIHCSSGPLFLATWPLFSKRPRARVCASLVPLASLLRLAHAGLRGRNQSPEAQVELVKAISRTGHSNEALRGPFLYTIVLFIATCFFWRESPIGLIFIAQMAAGDGLADLIGRHWGGGCKWPGCINDKSMIGSLAFVAGGFTISWALCWWFSHMGCFTFPAKHVHGTLPALSCLALISLACAAAELVPGLDDNLTVPFVAACLSKFLFRP